MPSGLVFVALRNLRKTSLSNSSKTQEKEEFFSPRSIPKDDNSERDDERKDEQQIKIEEENKIPISKTIT